MKRAFTLIEMLAATALSALLMVGLMRVVGTVRLPGRSGQSPQAHNTSEAHDRFLDAVDLIQWDLVHARMIRLGQNTVTVEGYSSLQRTDRLLGGDRARVARPHRPVRVRYFLRTVAGQTWLVRQQTDLDDPTSRNTWAELVACGVDRFEWVPEQTEGPREAAEDHSLDHEPGAVPARLRFILGSADPAVPEVSRTMILRAKPESPPRS
jgi:prepilin-type N-terminal cleavage/methylation domain-containing protein